MTYRPNQMCPVCRLPIRPKDPITTSFQGDPSNPESHELIVHRRCESALTHCTTCGQEFDEDESRLATTDSRGRPHSYHFGHQPTGEDHTSP